MNISELAAKHTHSGSDNDGSFFYPKSTVVAAIREAVGVTLGEIHQQLEKLKGEALGHQ